MREMNIEALYPKPRTSVKASGHKIYPYLLKDLTIDRPNQVWTTDITYLKMPFGFAYLVALIDVYSRFIVAWRVSNTMDTHFCLEMLEKGLIMAIPEILNTDQGSQFTSEAWIKAVQNAGIRVSMDGKGRWADNITIERFWRTLKHEHFLLHSFDNLVQVRESIADFIKLYNYRRLHQSLGYQTPAEVYGVDASREKIQKTTIFPPDGYVDNLLSQVTHIPTGATTATEFFNSVI
jgi:putative transposase